MDSQANFNLIRRVSPFKFKGSSSGMESASQPQS